MFFLQNTSNSTVPPSKPKSFFKFSDKSPLTSYSILTVHHSANDFPHLRSWNLYGSIDGCDWELVDTREDSNDLNGHGATANFECNIKSNGVYRFIKLQQTDIGFTGIYGFGMRRMDLFGILFESEYVPKCKYQTIKLKKGDNIDFYLCLILVIIY